MKIVLALFPAVCAWAQIQQPQLGAMLAGDASARPLFGVAGTITMGNSATSGVVSMGCSKQVCLMKTESSIVSKNGAVDAPPGPALFAFSGASAWIYFPMVRQLVQWPGAPINLDVAGEILSIHTAADGTMQFAVRIRSGTWVMGQGNTMLQSLNASGPVLLLDDGALFETPQGLVLRRADATEIQFHLEPVQSLSWLGENYVQVRVFGASYALRVDRGHERVFLLPEPQE